MQDEGRIRRHMDGDEGRNKLLQNSYNKNGNEVLIRAHGLEESMVSLHLENKECLPKTRLALRSEKVSRYGRPLKGVQEYQGQLPSEHPFLNIVPTVFHPDKVQVISPTRQAQQRTWQEVAPELVEQEHVKEAKQQRARRHRRRRSGKGRKESKKQTRLQPLGIPRRQQQEDPPLHTVLYPGEESKSQSFQLQANVRLEPVTQSQINRAFTGSPSESPHYQRRSTCTSQSSPAHGLKCRSDPTSSTSKDVNQNAGSKTSPSLPANSFGIPPVKSWWPFVTPPHSVRILGPFFPPPPPSKYGSPPLNGPQTLDPPFPLTPPSSPVSPPSSPSQQGLRYPRGYKDNRPRGPRRRSGGPSSGPINSNQDIKFRQSFSSSGPKGARRYEPGPPYPPGVPPPLQFKPIVVWAPRPPILGPFFPPNFGHILRHRPAPPPGSPVYVGPSPPVRLYEIRPPLRRPRNKYQNRIERRSKGQSKDAGLPEFTSAPLSNQKDQSTDSKAQTRYENDQSKLIPLQQYQLPIYKQNTPSFVLGKQMAQTTSFPTTPHVTALARPPRPPLARQDHIVEGYPAHPKNGVAKEFLSHGVPALEGVPNPSKFGIVQGLPHQPDIALQYGIELDHGVPIWRNTAGGNWPPPSKDSTELIKQTQKSTILTEQQHFRSGTLPKSHGSGKNHRRDRPDRGQPRPRLDHNSSNHPFNQQLIDSAQVRPILDPRPFPDHGPLPPLPPQGSFSFHPRFRLQNQYYFPFVTTPQPNKSTRQGPQSSLMNIHPLGRRPTAPSSPPSGPQQLALPITRPSSSLHGPFLPRRRNRSFSSLQSTQSHQSDLSGQENESKLSPKRPQ